MLSFASFGADYSFAEGKLTISGTGTITARVVKKKVKTKSKVKKVIIKDGITGIGDKAFENCSNLTSVTIPSSVISIGDSAFKGCRKLKKITIPNSITTIGNSAFGGCSNLTSVRIPNSVTSIHNAAFTNCGKLKNIYYIGDEVTWSQIKGATMLNGKKHYSGKRLIVKKIWEKDSHIEFNRKKPKLTLYAKNKDNSDDKLKPLKEGEAKNGKDYKEYEFKYLASDGVTYKNVQFNEDGTINKEDVEAMGTNQWQCEILIYYYYFNKNYKNIESKIYAVSEDAMEGYTSTAPTPAP